MFQSFGSFGPLSYGTFKVLGLPSFELVMLCVSLCILFVVDYHIAYRPDRPEALVTVPKLPIVAGVGLTCYVLLFGVMGRIEFIYFQF